MILRPFRWLSVLAVAAIAAAAAAAQDRPPVIVIPGLTGSELINQKTGEVVWFKAPRSKDDDLRLPITLDPRKAGDNLVAGDILRKVKFGIFPSVDVYGGLIEAFKSKAGYHEESWEEPTASGAEASIYIYAYDWRLDNVENARRLIRKVEAVKARLKRPDLRFTIVAHSMGGIIARYAAMYGDADLPTGGRRPQPTWAGSKHFARIFLLGTPSEGSPGALSSLINGFAIGGVNINLPWVQNLSRFDVFTIPSAYQLMPAPGSVRMLDSGLDPMDVDLYDVRTWTRYGWNTIQDKRFAREFTPAEVREAPAFLKLMLDRARRLHEALAAGGSGSGYEFDLVGADCKPSLDTIVLYRDSKRNTWRTIFKPTALTRPGGAKITSDELKELILADGDGVVTRRSLEARGSDDAAPQIRVRTAKFLCEEHTKLAANAEIQDHLINSILGVSGN